MANMIYQCVYCKASYDHDQSYKHNAYDCPKVRGKGMKKALIGALVVCLIGLSGCDAIDKYLNGSPTLEGAQDADIVLYKNGVQYKYRCKIDEVAEKFTNCTEVK